MATMLEAKPFVLGMSLRQTRKIPFRLFQNDGILLIISGIGKANAAMATAYSCLKFKPACICNLGAAGATHSGYDLGEICHIQKIVEPDRPNLKTGKPCVHKPDLLAVTLTVPELVPEVGLTLSQALLSLTLQLNVPVPELLIKKV